MQITEIKTNNLRWFIDNRHGWIRVPYKLLVEYRLVDKISEYSYLNGKWAYLEEDQDALIFLSKLDFSFEDMKRLPVTRCNGQSVIRTYKRFTKEALDNV